MQNLNIPRLTFLLIILLAAILLNNTNYQLYGDGSEYFQMIISLKNHFSPDLRLEDKLEYIANFPGCGIPLNAYFTALSDRGGGILLAFLGLSANLHTCLYNFKVFTP